MSEAEFLPLEAVGDDAGDQKARDDEEDVDADEATAHPAWKRVEGDDRQDRDAPQAVDVGPIGEAGARLRAERVGQCGLNGHFDEVLTSLPSRAKEQAAAQASL